MMKRFLFVGALLVTILTASAQYQGDVRLGDTIDFKFTTVDSTGAPTTLSSSPVISCYPGNSTTEITAGITLSADFDSRTGMNNVRVVASSGNGYATATNYQCVVTTGTVSGVSAVGYVVGGFSIEGRSALMPTTATRTLDVSATGEGGVDWANVGSPTTTLALTGTTIATTQKVDVDTIKTNPVVNAGTITFPTGATLASTTNITAGTIATVTNQLTGAAIATAIWTDTTAGDFTTALSIGKSVMNGVSLGTGLKVNQLTTNLDKTDYELTTAYADTAELADAVWDEATAGHSTAGTTGKALTDAGSAGDPWGTALPGAYTAGTAGFIVGTTLVDGMTNLPTATAKAMFQVDTGETYSTAVAGSAVKETADNAGGGASAADVWDYLTSSATTSGSMGKLVVDNLNATVSSRMATFTLPTNFSSLSIDGSGRVDVIKLAGTTQTARDIGASVLLSSGTGTGQLSFTSGVVKSDVDTIKTNPVVNGGTITFPSGATLASTTNITAGTMTTTTTATNVTNVNGLAAGVITAASIAANAFTAAKLDPDVTTELQAGLATSSALSTLQTTANDIPTNAELATALGTADDATLAQVALVKAVTDKLDSMTEFIGGYRFTDDALAEAPTGGSVDPDVAAIKVVTDKLETMIEDADVPGYRYTMTALENAPLGSGASAEAIATAVWVESISGKPASEWLHRAGANP